MRGLVIGLPLSLALWGLIYLFIEYGFDAFAFVILLAGLLYILATIKRDWKHIAPDEWEDGETTGYGDASR